MHYEIQGWYAADCGWEPVSAYDTKEEAERDLVAYRDAEPNFPHRIEEVGE